MGGIICPECQEKIAPGRLSAIDARATAKGAAIRRRRECRCGHRVTTYEQVYSDKPPEVEIKLVKVDLSPIKNSIKASPSSETMSVAPATLWLPKKPKPEPKRKGPEPTLPPFDELKRMVLDGISHREIADRYGVTHQAVSAALVAGGFNTRKYKREAVKRTVLQLHREGMTPAEIERAGVAANGRIHEIIREAGFTPHPRRLKQPGCSLCKVRPYARGYCKRCYGLWLTRRKGS